MAGKQSVLNSIITNKPINRPHRDTLSTHKSILSEVHVVVILDSVSLIKQFNSVLLTI